MTKCHVPSPAISVKLQKNLQMNGDELFRGQLNGKDQVPPGKRSSGFYFEGLYCHQPEDAPRLKTEFRTAQRRLLDEFDDAEDERDDTVEGDDILQVLLRGNRPRAGRRQFTDQVLEDQLPHFVRELNDAPPCYSKRKGTIATIESERQDEDRDGNYEKTSPLSWPLVAHWVGTLLIGISIVLTWPIGLAYFRD